MLNLDTIVLEGVHGKFRTLRYDHVTRQLESFGAHARNELAMLLSFLRIGDAVLDVGAHIGTYTVAFAKAVGNSGQVIAIEPSTIPFELLTENIALNGFNDRVITHNALIANKPDNYHAVWNPTHTSATYYLPGADGQTIPCLRLDSLSQELKLECPLRLIKIDVEGMEFSVLHSAKALLSKHKPLLFIEMISSQLARYGTTVNDLEIFLNELEYAFFRNNGVGNSTHDNYQIVKIDSLTECKELFNCLAIPLDRLAEELGDNDQNTTRFSQT